MRVSRNEARGGWAYAFPMVGIAFLLVCYWILADWQKMPTLIDGTLTSVHWPAWSG